MNIKITKNIYGNFRGFVTGQPSAHLGCNEWDACKWARDLLEANPDATYNPKSYFTLEEVLK
jgi:hypothetical protein